MGGVEVKCQEEKVKKVKKVTEYKNGSETTREQKVRGLKNIYYS